MNHELNEHQRIQSDWEHGIFGEERTVTGRFEKLREEFGEIFKLAGELGNVDALDPRDAKDLAMEVVDAIIVGLGCIDALGFDFDNLFIEKMMTNYRKYAVFAIKAYMNSGLSASEAIAKTKEDWNNRKFDI